MFDKKNFDPDALMMGSEDEEEEVPQFKKAKNLKQQKVDSP